MLLKIAAAMILAAGAAGASESIAPLPGESPISFQCRSTYIPQARQCMAGCDERLSAEGMESQRIECTQACGTKAQHAIGDCRRAGTPPAAALASR